VDMVVARACTRSLDTWRPGTIGLGNDMY
jgi:hypothetical protein